jgi:hypothetical protein
MLSEFTTGSETPLAKKLLQNQDLVHDLASLIVFDGSGCVLLGTVVPQDLQAPKLMSLFDSRDEAMTNGIDLYNEHFDVHRYQIILAFFYCILFILIRFHPEQNLVYGRSEDYKDGKGICIYRTKGGELSNQTYAVFTYKFPTISARAISNFIQFANANLEK